MSHPPPPKLTEARAKSKFQSLNINNIYQGAANKNTSKGPPPKHGLQSLGKVPTARRAPANLPSVKAEKGNDPRVLLVPTGGSGWTKDGEKPAPVQKPGDTSTSKPETKEPAAPVAPTTKPSGVKSWSSVTGASQQGRAQTFGHQKSPLFGQEFPSLRTGEGGVPLPEGADQKSQNQGVNRLQLESQPGKEDLLERNSYGPGPNLRPQTFGNWTQGGAKVPGGPLTDSQLDTGPIIPPQPHKPVPPGSSAQFTAKSPSNQSSSSNQYKSIMPPFMDAMELPAGPPEGMGGRRISRSGPQPRDRREPPQRSRPSTTTEFAPPSIIDTEKLRRMDDITGGDDWTFDDDNFDYNKRLQSDDEDVETESSRTDPNWADKVEKPSQPYNFYEDMKKPVGFGLEEEEKRRTKKSDEVLKNIERARQRREEEENRYRRPGSEEPYQEERGGGRRFDEGAKENRAPSVERKEWGYDDGRHKQPRSFDDRRDERSERPEQHRRDVGGYYPQRFGSTEDKSRKEELHGRNDIHFEDDYGKAYGGSRKEQRSFDDRNRSSDEAQAFTDFMNTEDSRSDSRWTGKSPVYNRQNSQLSTSESPEVELENGTNEWGRPAKGMSDWVEEVENVEFSDRYDAEVDQPSRPNSRDSRISRDSRGSKDGKGSRSSVEKTKKLPEFEEEKPGRIDNPIPEQYDVERKQPQLIHQAKKPAPVGQDLRGYFRDAPMEPKKIARAAPGPITREKLEASDNRETNSMTQLKKLDSKPESKLESSEKLNPLIDSDMLENISDDEDDLLDTLEREDKSTSHGSRGRGRGRGQPGDQRKPGSRGGRGGERGAGQRGARGGRGEYRGKGNHGRYMDQEGMEESEDMRNSRKGFDKFPDKQGPPPPIGFMPRGQPSRRGRGDGKSNRATFGRGGMSRYPIESEDHNEDVGDWNDEDMNKGRGGKIPPRMQKKREERRKMEGEEIEEWETASEHSNEEKEKRKREMERGRGRGRGWDTRGGRRGVGHPNDMREPTPEHDSLKKRSGIENIDLHDFASVVVVDQESGQHELEAEQGDAGEFMQVVNRKTRPINGRDDRKVFDRSGPKGNERGGYDPRYRDNFNKQNKTYERRQNKLPPRLAKVREVSRAQARSGGISPSGIEQNGWPEGDKMGVFQVEDLGTTAWEKPPPPRREKEGSEGPDMRASPKAGKENGGIQQTMVFENTALKGGKGEKMDKAGIQLPVGLGKPEDNLDVKLDFTFGGDDLSGQVKPQLRSMPHLSSSQGLPASPSTDDLSAKLANTKKLWDSPGMAAVPENSATTSSSWNDGTTFSENSGFESFQDSGNQGGESQGGYDKVDNVNNQANVAAKVKQQQQHLALDQDNRPNNNIQYNRMTNNTITGAIPSPPTQINQMGTMQPQPWAYPLDRNSTLYNPYGASQLNQSILMQGTHSIGTELFSGSNGAGGYRLQNTGHYPGSQQSTTNNVLISQANLISTGVKHSNQIGPIGTKAGTGANTSPYLQSGLGTLPNTFIQYDASNFNYVNPNAAGLQRGNAPPTQTAFYQTLASRQPQLALNAMPGTYNHALSQQQMRANHVAGLPFMKNDMSGLGNQKSPLGDNFGTGPSYNGRPSSPKTKQQQQQHHQQQAKLAAAGINNMNQLAQMRMSSLGYGMGIPGVQPGYPSPIARPQVNHGNPGNQGGHGMPGKVDYYTQDGGGGEEKAEKDLDKGVESKDSEAPGGEHDQGDQETGDTS